MMDRRQFLRRAGLIAAGVVAADQLDILEMLAPRSLFAGWSAPTAAYPSVCTVSTLAELYKKCNTDIVKALRLQTEEAAWFRGYPYEHVDGGSGRENRIVLHTSFTSNPKGRLLLDRH